MKHTITCVLLSIVILTYSNAQPFTLVKDINNALANTSSFPTDLIKIDDIVFFITSDPVHGRELWKTDGTTGGTVLVKDLNPGVQDGLFQKLINFNGILFFIANNELWKSDGSSSGTEKIFSGGYVGTDPGDFCVVGNTLFFTANQADITGIELWKTDGTTSGTEMVKDINPGEGSGNPQNLSTNGSLLFFTANDGVSGPELWKSDGSSIGTVMVKDINPGSNSSGIFYITAVSNFVFFRADNGVNGMELWKSDGTVAGTTLVKDIISGPVGSEPMTLVNANGILYFFANDGTHWYELWKSDGTIGGTSLVEDIGTQPTDFIPYGLLPVNNTVYFTAFTNTTGWELYKSDGTADGTFLVKDIRPGFESSVPMSLANLGDTVFFTVTELSGKKVLWKSQGTDVSTELVEDLGIQSVAATTIDGASLIMSAEGASGGVELWKSNGNANEAFMIKDIAENRTSNPEQLTAFQDQLFFTAIDGLNRPGIWKTNGTEPGTMVLRNFNNTPQHLTVANDLLMFAAQGSFSQGLELWKSDGTAAGTILVRNINLVNGQSSSPDYLVNVNGLLFFTANDGTHGTELWKSDGTPEGTVLVKDIRVGSPSSNPVRLTTVNGLLYFTASDGINGPELWKSDGTDAGTMMVKDILPGNSDPQHLMATDNYLFFFIFNDLWKTDGTADGTVMVKSFFVLGSPFSYSHIGDTIFFPADDNVTGSELWKSDGTPEGTVLVKNIAAGKAYSNPTQLTNINDNIFFTADDGINGVELWKTDGTTNGTITVKDINNAGSSNPSNFWQVNNSLAFIANDGISGEEPWISDGTDLGTMQLDDVEEGSGGVSITNQRKLNYVNGKLFGVFTTTQYGTEVWVTTISGPLPTNSLSFRGESQNQSNILSWHLSSIINLKAFELQRSVNGSQYETIYSTEVRENTLGYSYADKDLYKWGNYKISFYYRLKMINNEGEAEYSNIIKLTIEPGDGKMRIYPNPAKDFVKIVFGTDQQNAYINLIDAKGTVVLKKYVKSAKEVSINLKNLPPGIYNVNVKTNETTLNSRFYRE